MCSSEQVRTAKVDKAFKREGNSFTESKFTITDRRTERLRSRKR